MASHKIVLIMIIGALLAACEPYFMAEQSDNYAGNMHIVDSFDIKRQNNLVFSRYSNFYVARNIDDSSDYSKQSVGLSLKKSLDYFFNSVVVASHDETFEQSLASAKRKQLDYLVFPTLQVWDVDIDQWVDYRHQVPAPVQPPESQRGLLGAKSWKSGKTNAVTDSQVNDQLKLELFFVDAVSGDQVDSIQLNTEVGVFSDSHSSRPLAALDGALMSLMEQLSGSRGQF